MMAERLRVLELFCGIGGCAAALDGRADVIAAIDINRKALAVYQHNFSHRVVPCTIESLRADDFADWPADLWWMSPPCQPYTVRGVRRDLDDPRAVSLLALLDRIRESRPPYVALENVPGFMQSRAYFRVHEVLRECGYEVHELLLCPTQLGIPNRRRRFFLVAARGKLREWPELHGIEFRYTIESILGTPAEILSPPRHSVEAYRSAVHVVEPRDPAAVSHCFTSAYGKTITSSGSYLADSTGLRRFSPEEQLRLLGFPSSYSLPPYDQPRQVWPLIGNSLSVDCVRFVLSAVPELEPCPSFQRH
jgi:DNA (cytosine-5)-methyltransferase 1